MVKNVFLKGVMAIGILALTVPANAQGVTGLGEGFDYFLYGIIAFSVSAMTLTICLLLFRNKYLKEASGKTNTKAIFTESQIKHVK